MKFNVPNDHLDKHECPLAVIKCVDFRFRESDQEFIVQGLGFSDFDIFCWPGAAKAVLRQNGFKTELVEHIVSVSRGLHKIKKLLLLWHWDCDSYGGSKEFTDAQAEEEAYYKDLQSVRDILTKELPDDLEIIMAYSKPAPQGLEYQTIN